MIQIAQAFSLDPWAMCDLWTWPQLWVALRSLEDQQARAEAEMERARSGASTGGAAKVVMNTDPGAPYPAHLSRSNKAAVN